MCDPAGADALVLVVDARRRAERLLELVRPVQRRGPPLAVDVQNLARDLDVPLRGDLLQDQVHREERLERLRADRLVRARMQRRGRGLRQVGDEVVPGRGHLILGEDVLVGARGEGHGGKGTERWPSRAHGSPVPHAATTSKPSARGQTLHAGPEDLTLSGGSARGGRTQRMKIADSLTTFRIAWGKTPSRTVPSTAMAIADCVNRLGTDTAAPPSIAGLAKYISTMTLR